MKVHFELCHSLWLFCCMIHVLLHVLKHVDTFVVFSRHKVAVVNMFPPYAMKSNQQGESHADYRYLPAAIPPLLCFPSSS